MLLLPVYRKAGIIADYGKIKKNSLATDIHCLFNRVKIYLAAQKFFPPEPSSTGQLLSSYSFFFVLRLKDFCSILTNLFV